MYFQETQLPMLICITYFQERDALSGDKVVGEEQEAAILALPDDLRVKKSKKVIQMRRT